ncbi:M48 family metallopeptidase [Iodobacter sp. HSC-16F04]|uniref:M48 family metallopeptidase n=1 Tax=Iodobacter violaceini TaxID=3044271 RepID=A0ABX0L7T6_9NEIS|nr:M48 family metallopeptidase [Iodobacter violacea]NHQ88683.1 M48 family metallopeptidase [Iodobacter violacea]
MVKKLFWPLILLSLLLSFAIASFAPVSANAAARASAVISPASEAWRAALPADPMAATEAYMQRISPINKARSDAYFEGGYWLLLANTLLGIGACWIILKSGILIRIRMKAEKITRFKFLHTLSVSASFVFFLTLLSFPLTTYQSFFREHQYGLSNLSFSAWLTEQTISTTISVLSMGFFLSLIYLLIQKMPRLWWAFGAILSIGLLSVMMLLGPVYIDPIFNKYQALSDQKIKEPILSIARANGIPADNVYQFDASKQSNRISANVSGIFGSAAIRLNDNLLHRCSPSEIEAVMGHEIGHYVLNHVYTILLNFGLILLFGFIFIHKSMTFSVKRWGQKHNISHHSDPVSLPFFMAFLSAYFFFITPVQNTIIRTIETEADAFGINAARQADGMAEANLKLTEYRKSDPGDLEELFFFDHPSPKKRIYAAMRWKAEHLK